MAQAQNVFAKNMQTHRKKILAAAAAFILAAFLAKNAAVALFDTNRAVHIDPDAIENSTLIIGTHLIYLHSLNEQIYEIAMQSASDSDQQKRYYKSELAGGQWMDITDAGSISDISSGGIVADLEEIKGLYMTHHTKSDGITYDLRTNKGVCMFDIVDMYDLENMPELEPLKMQYDRMQQLNYKSPADKHNIGLAVNFWQTSVKTGQTDQYDRQLSALQKYYEELSANNADSKYMETVLGVMEKVSNARKAEVYNIIAPALEGLQTNVSNLDWAKNDGKDDENAFVDDALMTAIGDSISAIGESLAEAEGNMLSEGTTVISAKDYGLSQSMISNAEGANFFACDEQNIQLQHLNNIKDSRIADAAGELTLLDELIGSAEAKYGAALSIGATPEYGNLVAQKVSHAALESRMKADTEDAGIACGELEFLIQEAVNRKSSNDSKTAQDYVLQKIEDAPKFAAGIKQDDYSGQYQDSVSGYIQWLNSLLSSLKQAEKGDGSGGGQESLYDQKAKLQEQKLNALDALDIDTAKKYDAAIADIDAKIDELENAQAQEIKGLMEKKAELSAQLKNNPQDANLLAEIGRLEAQLADGASDVSGSSQAANIINSKNELMKILTDGDTGEAAKGQLSNNIDVLCDMLKNDSPLALAALKEVYGKMLAKAELDGVSGYDDLLEAIESAVSESAVSDLMALGAGDGTADAPSDIADALEALNRSDEAAVFTYKKFGGISYIPAKTLAGYLGYRYIWNESKKKATLSRGKDFYRFTAYEKTVEAEKDDALKMDEEAIFSGELFVPCSFVQQQFDCYIYEVPNTEYCAIVKDKETLEKLIAEGGG